MISPYMLKIMLDVYCGAEIEASKVPAPIYDETVAGLVDAGYLRQYGRDEVRPADREYDRTAKLVTLIDHIMQLPQPEWRMPC